jgi:hypothetical protein
VRENPQLIKIENESELVKEEGPTKTANFNDPSESEPEEKPYVPSILRASGIENYQPTSKPLWLE